jgi:hypothetical protein
MLNPTGNEVIIISDDELPARKFSSSTSKARNKRKAPRSPVLDGDVLEIMTSEDENNVRTSGPPPPKLANSEVTALQKKLKLVQTVRGI